MQLADRRQFSMPCGNGGKLLMGNAAAVAVEDKRPPPTPLPLAQNKNRCVAAFCVMCPFLVFISRSLDIRYVRTTHTHTHTYVHIKRPRRFEEVEGWGVQLWLCCVLPWGMLRSIFVSLQISLPKVSSESCTMNFGLASPQRLRQQREPASVSTISADANGICLCIFITNELDHPLYRLTA